MQAWALKAHINNHSRKSRDMRILDQEAMGDTSDGDGPNEPEGSDGDPLSSTKKPRGWFARFFASRSQAQSDLSDTATNREDDASPGTGAMMLNLQRMRSVRVEEVSIPRPDIVAVPDDATLEDAIAVFRESGLTRLPVFSDTLDAPKGFIHLKDFALQHGFGKSDGFDLQAMIRPLIYAPPSMRIPVLLQKMQAERVHMALVIDEYGGVDGLVTIEDLVEQIVGEIVDEHDTAEDQGWVEEGPGVFRAIARTTLTDFESVAGVDLLPDALDEEVDTLGGLVFHLAGRVPARGELVKHPSGHEFEVIDADARQVKRLRVRLAGAPALERAAE